MGNYETSIDSVSVNATGGTETGNKITVDNRDTISIQIEGDAESANFDLELQGKNGNATTTYGDVDTTSYTGQDITGNTNTSKIYLFDVSGLSDIKPKIINNHDSATTITATVGVDNNN